MAEFPTNGRLRFILVFFILFGFIGMLTIIGYGLSTRSVGSCLIWAISSLIAGIAIGFLFGIPKILQGSQSTGEDKNDLDYKLHVNTNLTEISDWLTKIIVGLGLVKLTKLPPYLASMALSFSDGIPVKDKKAAMTVGYGTIIFFSVLGFLFGYLITRLFLSKAFVIADKDSLQGVKGQLEIQIANIESKQAFLAQSLTSESHNENISAAQALFGLKLLADEYLGINIADWGERTRAKDAKANEMTNYMLKNGIDSQILFDYIKEQSSIHEGLVLALASLINIDPHQNDFDKLVQVGEGLTRLHVRYRILLAIVTLQKRGDIGGQVRRLQAINLVKAYRSNADAPLVKQINYTLSFLTSVI